MDLGDYDVSLQVQPLQWHMLMTGKAVHVRGQEVMYTLCLPRTTVMNSTLLYKIKSVFSKVT